MATIAYLRVSTLDQSTEKNKADVLVFANDRRLGHVTFIEETVSGKVSWRERKIGQIINDLSVGDKIIVPELTRLGRSTLDVLQILKTSKEKGLAVYSIKENLTLNGNDEMQSKIMVTFLSLFAELERDFISKRTKEGLAARKAAGVKLGRPKGPGKSKLDSSREEIIALLKMGVSKARILKKYSASRTTFDNWLRKNSIEI
jgi:DNA invertase Pin-like site-specific DNA recombinase